MKFLEPEPAPVEDPYANLLKVQLVDIIKWISRKNPRSHQVMMGPSEIGDDCDRRLGYRLVGVPAVNVDFDPWPSVMGTAMHAWLEKGFRAWMREHPSEDPWLVENTLHIGEFMVGHSDLYRRGCVIDWKSAGPDVMRKVRSNGPPERYKVQAHTYGYGFAQLGYPVERVALVFLPRAGWLRDMYIWTEPYVPQIAEVAMSRVYGIAQNLLELDILNDANGHRWEQVNAVPSDGCGFCPWYDPGRDPERGADQTGCPGRG